MQIKEYIINCFLKAREGEVIFIQGEYGHIRPNLDGYDIIPREDYDELRIKAGETIEPIW